MKQQSKAIHVLYISIVGFALFVLVIEHKVTTLQTKDTVMCCQFNLLLAIFLHFILAQ